MKTWDPLAQRWALAGAIGFLLLAALFAAARLWIVAALLGAAAPLWYLALMDRWTRRTRLAKEPFPEAWRAILEKDVEYYRGLPAERRADFERQVRFFLAEHRFSGVAGQEATDELRVLAAASAVMLVFHRPGQEYPRIAEILFYPRGFDEDYRTRGPGRWMAGQNTDYGTVVFAAPELLRSFRNGSEAYHVGLHEFAHALDRSGGHWDGLPPGLASGDAASWVGRLNEEMGKILDGRSALCAYGASNEVEFFAVATETYFKTPNVLRRRNPELFRILEDYYGPLPGLADEPDPEPGKRRPGSASPPGPRRASGPPR